jgi:hypothetical protein
MSGPAPGGRLSALRAVHSNSVFCMAVFVRARRARNRRTRRFPARAVLVRKLCADLGCQIEHSVSLAPVGFSAEPRACERQPGGLLSAPRAAWGGRAGAPTWGPRGARARRPRVRPPRRRARLETASASAAASAAAASAARGLFAVPPAGGGAASVFAVVPFCTKSRARVLFAVPPSSGRRRWRGGRRDGPALRP